MVSGTILCVDDDLLVLRAIKRDLQVAGYHAISAQNVASALNILAHEPVDIVISDYSMPGPNGLDLVAAISRDYPNIVRVMLTGHAALEMALAAINAGHVYHFLTKPWSKDELVKAVTRCFDYRKSQLVAPKKVVAAPIRKMSVGELEMQFPGISYVKRNEGGVISLEDFEGADQGFDEIEALLRSAQ